ncbi:hypothetical protein Taro_041440 [Colocasia esculenta]|uniref:SCP domain-containing protein n=1 Tax=Colocasia esculenta TaxID=4460 RepID=A0A843WPV2_COLES|nr:hypothetical protein [Colocasia esculenta]
MTATWSDEDANEDEQATSGDKQVQCLMARSDDSNEGFNAIVEPSPLEPIKQVLSPVRGLQCLREVVCSLPPRATETMAAAFFTSCRLLVAVATLALCVASSAVAARSRILLADTPADKPNATVLFLSEHNETRAAVGVAPLKWSPCLAGEASRLMRYQRDKKGCEFVDLSSSNYGANQAWSSYVARSAEVVE